MSNTTICSKLFGKIIITADLNLEAGLHIGGSSEFSAIGAIDNPIIRDTVTKQPYIPGSSLKGKVRFLLARDSSDTPQIKIIEDENIESKRLFGSSKKNEIHLSRLQFFDIYLKEESVSKVEKLSQDSYLTEIKFENTINRKTGVANPRQIERVPRSSVFNFKVVYNIENLSELREDFENIFLAFALLQDDYLGGSGSRGYGKIKFNNFKYETKIYGNDKTYESEINDQLVEFEDIIKEFEV